jgi:hypothetical protein
MLLLLLLEGGAGGGHWTLDTKVVRLQALSCTLQEKKHNT